MDPDIEAYNAARQRPAHRRLCDLLAERIAGALPEAEPRIWHRHPVWFLAGNPVAGYSEQTRGIRLMFWSGADFGEVALDVRGSKFRDASLFLNAPAEVDPEALDRWLGKAREIQWDYANVAKRKGRLERLR